MSVRAFILGMLVACNACGARTSLDEPLPSSGADDGLPVTDTDDAHVPGSDVDSSGDEWREDAFPDSRLDAGGDSFFHDADADAFDGAIADAFVGPLASLRIAYMAESLGDLDVCIGSSVASGHPSFVGSSPIFGGSGSVLSAINHTVSSYLDVPASGTAIRFVPSGATTCNTEALPGTTYSIRPLKPGTLSTAVFFGDPSSVDAKAPVALSVLTDETVKDAGTAMYPTLLRVFHADFEVGPLDIGWECGGYPGYIWVATPYGSDAVPGNGDANGYASVYDACTDIIASPHPGSEVAEFNVPQEQVKMTTVLTVYLVPSPTIGAMDMVVCDDTSPVVGDAGNASNCRVAQSSPTP